MNRVLNPEFEFLCYLVRHQPDHERALELTRQELDFALVAHLAAAHGVRPHLLKALNDNVWAGRVSELKQKLDVFQCAHMARNLHLASQLLRVVNAFDEYGIPFATFKGIALATSLYGDISRREFNDIDIIVRTVDVSAAESALQSCGYRPALGSSREWRKAFLAYQRQHMFVDADSVTIDLHWGLTREGFPFPLRASDIWSTLERMSIAGRPIPTFGPEVMGIYLAAHGAKEGWRCLGWVCDFAEFYQRHSEMDWIELWRRVDRRKRQILLGLALATDLLGIPVRDELLQYANRDPKIRALAELTVQRMLHLTDRKNPHPEMELAIFEICETWSERLRVIWHLACTRTTGDYEAMPLPRPLWRLYHLTRPFRLAGKVLSVR
jgi:putative nucleotidyltransferase-like protein